MRRRLVLLSLACLAFAAAPALAGDAGRKQTIDARIAALHARVAADRAREERLAGAIKGVTARIQTLEKQVGTTSRRLASLQRDLTLHHERLDKLTQLFELETRRLMFLRHEYSAAVRRLAARVVGIYESDEPDTLGVILSASSFNDALDSLDYQKTIASSDKHIAVEVDAAKHEVARARAKTAVIRNEVAAETRLITQKTQQQQALQLTLIARRQGLKVTARMRNRQLAATRTDEKQEMEEESSLAAESAAIAARIQAAQAAAPPSSPGGASDTTPSSSGLIWPVSGPVTSPFGMRWGRMHEGIDIGVGYGTPIHAAASGRVIYAGWMSGYGNFVIIDHGGGMATAYGHQSRIAVGNGQSVTQGQVIGYVGCTGHCFGPHLHFEVRINGQPVDPMRYL